MNNQEFITLITRFPTELAAEVCMISLTQVKNWKQGKYLPPARSQEAISRMLVKYEQ